MSEICSIMEEFLTHFDRLIGQFYIIGTAHNPADAWNRHPPSHIQSVSALKLLDLLKYIGRVLSRLSPTKVLK